MRAGVQRGDQSAQRRRLDQRGVGKHDQHVAAMAFQCRSRRQNGIAGAGLNRLLEDLNIRCNARRLGPHRPGFGTNHECKPAGPRGLRGCQRMAQHRPAANAMEHLRQVRAHAHAFAGGKEDDQKGSFGHGALLIGARRVALPSVPACWDYATIMPAPRKTARFCELFRAKTGLTTGSTLAQQCYGTRSTCPQPGQPAPVPCVDRAPPNLRPFHYDSICAVRRAFAQQRLNLERGRARPWLRIPISLPAPGGS